MHSSRAISELKVFIGKQNSIRKRKSLAKDSPGSDGYWGCLESDVHLFSCAGYNDLLVDVKFDMFMTLEASTEELLAGAQRLLKVVDLLVFFIGS